MFMRALAAFLLLPGVAAFLLPPLLGAFDPWRHESIHSGIIVMAVGATLLLWCVRDFYVSGRGTLAPWDPPANLVVVGLYRYMRNPMYAGVIALVVGWALCLGSLAVAIYATVLTAGFHIRVVVNEEPWLETRFGPAWHAYASEVNRWLPRLSPWRGGT